MKVLQRSVLLVMGVLFLTSCTRTAEGPKGSEEVLSAYISRTFNVEQVTDRNLLLELTTDRLREALAALSDEAFKKRYLGVERRFLKLRILNQQTISEEEHQITFELAFMEKQKGYEAKITQKQLAILKQKSGTWLISEVRGMKELVEYDEGLNIPGVVSK